MTLSESQLNFQKFSQASQIASIQPLNNYDQSIPLVQDISFPRTTFKSQAPIQLKLGQQKDVAISFLTTNGSQFIVKLQAQSVTASCSPLLQHVTEQVWASKLKVQSNIAGNSMCQVEICLNQTTVLYIVLYFETIKDLTSSNLYNTGNNFNQSANRSLNNSQLYSSTKTYDALPVQTYTSPVNNYNGSIVNIQKSRVQNDAFLDNSQNSQGSFLPQSAIFNSKLAGGSALNSFPQGEVYGPSIIQVANRHHSQYCYDSGTEIPANIIEEAQMSNLKFSQINMQNSMKQQEQPLQPSFVDQQQSPVTKTWSPKFEMPDHADQQVKEVRFEQQQPKQFMSPLNLDEIDYQDPCEKSVIDSEPQENVSDLEELPELKQAPQEAIKASPPKVTHENIPQVPSEQTEPSSQLNSELLLTKQPSGQLKVEEATIKVIPDQLFFLPATQTYPEIAKLRIQNTTSSDINIQLNIVETQIDNSQILNSPNSFTLDNKQLTIPKLSFKDITIQFTPEKEFKGLITAYLTLTGQNLNMKIPLVATFGTVDINIARKETEIQIKNEGNCSLLVQSDQVYQKIEPKEEKIFINAKYQVFNSVFADINAGKFDEFFEVIGCNSEFKEQIQRIQKLSAEDIEMQ